MVIICVFTKNFNISTLNLHLSSRNYRRRLEHLFYVADPEKNDEKQEILSIIEEGFKTAENYKVCIFFPVHTVQP